MSERLAMRPVADVILAPPCAWHEVRPLTCAWAIPSRPAVQRQRVALTGWPVIVAGSGLCTAMGWHGTRQTNPPATRTRSAPAIAERWAHPTIRQCPACLAALAKASA